MDSRREFLKKTMLLSGAVGLSTVLPPSIQRALAINPAPGSTYLDAEHVVILMQENRSFDHCFGSLQGVRGFNDPRAFTLASGNPVWLQADTEGKTYAPFRLNMLNTKATWMGDIPHSRASQVDAYNGGKYDQWIESKRSSHKNYAAIPLTMGFYNREDLPFNYAMADAFTVCDQNFCSAMTSTWPNRHYLWTGTIREQQNEYGKAHIRNDLAFGEAKWKTFPERLEENDISWKIYQNDITCGGGFEGEERSWLANFGCNPLEFFERYRVKFSSRYIQGLQKQSQQLPVEISRLKEQLSKIDPSDKDFKKKRAELNKKQEVLLKVRAELKQWSRENFGKLPQVEKDLHEKAFSKNSGDPDYHTLTKIKFMDGVKEREISVPKGDVFYQFRKDVNSGNLPTVSWLTPPQKFSDHPSAPWYGAWYVSEILDILTKNPEVWKKTIFILTYDENDGYFDHIPPFLPPDITKPNSGKCSEGIDASVEYIHLEQELKEGISQKAARGGQIGLGFRVPMIIASPWTRGGKVCSEVFDHTSTLQFLEEFLSRKFNKNIKEENISQWRRAVCGDLTSAFAVYEPEKKETLAYLKRDPFVGKIYSAQFKEEPRGYKALSENEIEQAKNDISSFPYMPEQEKGVRSACALPYELYVDGNLRKDKKGFELRLEASDRFFGSRAVGSPFTVYAPVNFRSEDGNSEKMKNWQYALAPGSSLDDTWDINSFENKQYHLRVYGPNGFFREFIGNPDEPLISVKCGYEQEKEGSKITGNVELNISNLSLGIDYVLELTDFGYAKNNSRKITLKKGSAVKVLLDLQKNSGWYDFNIQAAGFNAFEKRYAGRVETGKESLTDPVMGKIV